MALVLKTTELSKQIKIINYFLNNYIINYTVLKGWQTKITFYGLLFNILKSKTIENT